MFHCVQIMCAKYYELSCMFKKNAPAKSWRVCLTQPQNSRYFWCLVWKTKSWFKKQTYTKTETCKLYSGVFWTFLPNVIKIDRYNFELYRFKVGRFLRHSVSMVRATRGYRRPANS